MSTRDGGGPAFPTHDFEYYPGGGGVGCHTITGGMSLRDWFAGQALAALARTVTTEDQAQNIGKTCYWLADKALAAREPSE